MAGHASTDKLGIKTYKDAAEFLGGKSVRTVPGICDTQIYMAGDDIRVVYHHTAVVTYKPSGKVVFCADGWESPTTKSRFNAFTNIHWSQKTRKFFAYDKTGEKRYFYEGIEFRNEDK